MIILGAESWVRIGWNPWDLSTYMWRCKEQGYEKNGESVFVCVELTGSQVIGSPLASTLGGVTDLHSPPLSKLITVDPWSLP